MSNFVLASDYRNIIIQIFFFFQLQYTLYYIFKIYQFLTLFLLREFYIISNRTGGKGNFYDILFL